MAEKYLFFNSTMEDRRRYQASDIAEYWSSFLSSGLIHVNGKPNLKVESNGENMKINIDMGKALILGQLYINTDSLEKEIRQATANEDRFDRVVLRLDLSMENRYIKAFVKEGTDEGPPNLTREGLIYEVSLAQIHVKAGKNYLEQSDIIDERLNEGLCGLASSLVSVPTDVFMQEWQEWFTKQQTEGFVLASEITKSNYVATRRPTSSDDEAMGYQVGSLWIYNASGLSIEYICMSAIARGAIWVRRTIYVSYYKLGNEYSELTGGWIDGLTENEGSRNKEQKYLQMVASSPGAVLGYRGYDTAIKIDVSNLETINIVWEAFNEGDSISTRLILTDNLTDTGSTANNNAVARLVKSGSYTKGVSKLDVSSLRGSYYLRVYVSNSKSQTGDAELKVYEIWGE